jgi:peptidoglycan/LPS O-acetylase OafA/YrhL
MSGIRISHILKTRLSRATVSTRYIPEVDGIRCIAVTLVFWHHIGQALETYSPVHFANPPRQQWIWQTIQRGNFGVELFFALSGFIIALPFATRALAEGSAPNLRQYYLRRLTRLEPPYAIAMTIYFLWHFAAHNAGLGFLGWLPHYLASLFYVHKFFYGTFSRVMSVAWSLEIEIQFYLIAPLLAMIFRVRRPELRRSGMIAFGVLFVIWNYFTNDSTFPPDMHLLNFLSFFIVGYLLADLYVSYSKVPPRRSLVWDLVSLVGWPLVVIDVLPFRQFFAIFPALILLLYVAAFRGRFVRVFFTNVWITTIGGMCYTIYLIHLGVLNLLIRSTRFLVLTRLFWVNLVLQLFLILPFLTLFALIFFILIERPCMDRNWPSRLWSAICGFRGGPVGEPRPSDVAASLQASESR